MSSSPRNRLVLVQINLYGQRSLISISHRSSIQVYYQFSDSSDIVSDTQSQIEMSTPKRNLPLSLDDFLQKGSNDIDVIPKSKPSKSALYLSKTQRRKINETREIQSEENRKRPKILHKLPRASSKTPTKTSDIQQLFTPKIKPSKKRFTNERKFKFDWSDDEDTLGDYTPILDFKSPKIREQKYDNLEKQSYHWSNKPLNKMSERDWRIMREDYDISYKGGKVINPLRAWREGGISPMILDQLDKLDYKEPTPIQRASIPIGLSGKDLVGVAETGSGKTLAFIVPILNYVTGIPDLTNEGGPFALIIVPTRELALQIETEFEKFKHGGLRFSVASFIGGHTYEESMRKVEYGIDVVIATPGRLIDSVKQKIISLDQCFFLVMDEVDRMVDMGFESQVNNIMECLPPGDLNPYYFGKGSPQRVTMMFTATMPPAIEKLTANYLSKPVMVKIGEVGSAVDTVDQNAFQVTNDERRIQLLKQIMSSHKYRPPIIVFVNYRKTCELVAEELNKSGWRVVTIHGSKSQDQREASIQEIKGGHADILVATDVAARGIDISDVSLVLNYQMSSNIQEYTHRIGRTGRAGKKGTAITFWNANDDKEVLYDLKKMLLDSPSGKCPEDLRRNEDAQRRLPKNIEL